MSQLRGFNRRQSGFSLVEAMVGITVGLATVLIITQTMSLFQGGRSSAVSGANAQENGLFAMHLVATDIRSSGAGSYAATATGNQNLYTCTNVCSFYGSGSGACSGSATATVGAIAAISGYTLTGASKKLQLPLFPIIIETAGTDAPGISSGVQFASGTDIVTVRSPSRFVGSVPAAPTSASVDMAGTTAISVNRTFGFGANYRPPGGSSNVNDLALITNGTNCFVFEVTDVNSSGLAHASGTSFNPTSYTWPSTGGSAGTCPGGAPGQCFSSSAAIYNLGTTADSPVIANEYSVASGGTTLQMRSIGTTNSSSSPPILSMADGIVALKAQYGVADSETSAPVTSWVGSDSSTWNSTWKPSALTVSNAKRIRAVRILVVARSANREATAVTTACATTGYVSGPCPSGGTSEPATSTLPAINLAGLPWNTSSGEWQHYRYKIYTTVVPIRNILWNGAWDYTGGTYTGQ